MYFLLQKAVNKLQQLMSQAMDGHGVDRHLLGLYLICQEEGMDIPAIFTDPAFRKTGGDGNYILSTSCVGYSSEIGGVPPMRHDGYACFYGIEDNRITFSCFAMKSCEDTNAGAFFKSIW